MKRYPQYKDSGALWLGQVPAHWPLVRYKYVFNERVPRKDSALPAGAISYGKVVLKDDDAMHVATKASYQEVLKGDFLVNPINLNYDLKSLRTALSEIDVCVSPAYIVLRPSIEADSSYLKHQLNVFDVSHMKTLGAGVRQTISFKDIGNCWTVMPPREEQEAISFYLDEEVGRIDAAISSQERMIELLKERRSVIITQAVTKGLDPKAKMKDSGVPWLGQVPAHWAIVPAYVLAPATRRSISVEALRKKRVAHFSIPNVQDYGTAVIEDGDTIDSGKMVVEGLSVLVSRLNPRKRTVAIADVFSDADVTVCSGEFVMFRPKSQCVSRLLSLFFVSNPVAAFIESLVASTTKSHGRADPHVIKRMQVAVPPPDELEQIVSSISQQIAEIDSVISRQILMINLLKERRSSIITQAVTGQIDVR